MGLEKIRTEELCLAVRKGNTSSFKTKWEYQWKPMNPTKRHYLFGEEKKINEFCLKEELLLRLSRKTSIRTKMH
jgi:hypothetical protein